MTEHTLLKIGDEVRCVRAALSHEQLTISREYVICDVSDFGTYVSVDVNACLCDWDASRFLLIRRHPENVVAVGIREPQKVKGMCAPTVEEPTSFTAVPEELLDVAAQRKATPIYSGVLMYFPKAMSAIAQCSMAGNEQHNPGEPLHWAREKSGDELDALARHLMDAGSMDTDGVRHSTKVAWRALANLEKELEKEDDISS